jgi:hypothetical protein
VWGGVWGGGGGVGCVGVRVCEMWDAVCGMRYTVCGGYTVCESYRVIGLHTA